MLSSRATCLYSLPGQILLPYGDLPAVSAVELVQAKQRVWRICDTLRRNCATDGQ